MDRRSRAGGEFRRRSSTWWSRSWVLQGSGSEKNGSAKFVASGRSSPGGLPWWGRRGVPGIAAAELPLRYRAKRAAAARVCVAACGVDGVQGVRWAV